MEEAPPEPSTWGEGAAARGGRGAVCWQAPVGAALWLRLLPLLRLLLLLHQLALLLQLIDLRHHR